MIEGSALNGDYPIETGVMKHAALGCYAKDDFDRDYSLKPPGCISWIVNQTRRAPSGFVTHSIV